MCRWRPLHNLYERNQLGAGLESAEKPRCSARKSPPGGAAAVVFEELLVVVEELVGVFEGSSREEV